MLSTTLLVALSVLPAAPPRTIGPVQHTPGVHVTGVAGTERLGTADRRAVFLLPLTSLSEVVVRPDLSTGALELEIDRTQDGPVAPPSVTEIRSAATDTLVLDDGAAAGVRALANLRLPVAIESPTGEDLAHVARRDHECIAGGRFTLRLPDDPPRHLVLFGLDAERHGLAGGDGWNIVVGDVPTALHASANRPAILDVTGLTTDGARGVLVELGDACVDAVWLADGGSCEVAGPLEGERVDDPSRPGAFRFPVPDGPGDLAISRAFVVRTGGRRVVDAAAGDGPGDGPDDGPNDGLRRRALCAAIASHSSTGRMALGDAAPALVDGTDDAGLRFVHLEGPPEQLDIRPTMGPGAAWGDVDGDGRLDLVLLQGGGREGSAPLADRLYLGADDGRFRDATGSAGLGRGDAGMGALLLDVDGDGDLDLYCANYGPDRLFLGNGDGTFEDATALLPAHAFWSASVTAADADGDRDLDLYVTSYLDYDPAKMPPANELGRYQREDPIEMLPFAFPGQRNVFLRNRLADTGQLGFDDATEELGLSDVQGRGMQAVFWDFDRDGDQDLYVANDVSFNVLFRNEGDGTFEDVSFSTGLDDPRGGMGLAVGDVDRDGDEDLFLTNWQLETNALYLNGVVSSRKRKRRHASFRDHTVPSGLGPSGIGKTSWGAELFDLELDGDLDLFVANGYTSPDYEGTGICVGQPDQLFVGDGRGHFVSADDLAREALARALASRGAIGADFDRDGDVDLCVTANNGRARLLRNESKRAGTWVGVELRQSGANRRAIGAEVRVRTPDGRERRQTLRAGQGYLTGNAPELHFGLGDVSAIEAIVVRWPDGTETTHAAEPGRWVTLER